MAAESRGFVLLLTLGGTLLAAGIASLFVLATSQEPSDMAWAAAWILTAVGGLTFVTLAAWPLLRRLTRAVRQRLQYRASNHLDASGRRWLQLSRPSDEVAWFRLTLVDPGGGGGRKEFAQPGDRVLVEFPGRDFD